MDQHNYGDLLYDLSRHRISQEGSLPNWSTIRDRLCRETESVEFDKGLLRLKDNFDRMRFVFSHPTVRPILDRFLGKWNDEALDRICGKNALMAAKYRQEGNESFTAKRCQEAVGHYTKAMLFAPQNSSEASLAYANRSAAYFHLCEYENALLDIESAKAYGYAQHRPVLKLQFRQVDSMLRLGRAKEAKQLLDEIAEAAKETVTDKKRWEELIQMLNNPPSKMAKVEPGRPSDINAAIEQLKSKGCFVPNEKISSISSKVKLCYHPTKGRHLVALEDLDFGEIISICKPYAVLLRESHELRMCHHCCRPLKPFHPPEKPFPAPVCNRPIACAYCVNVLYCSEQCLADSWEQYHRFECKFLPLLYPTFGSHLALRMLYRAGLDKIRAAIDIEKNTTDFDDPLNLQDPEDYSHVYRLVHHSDLQQNDEDFLYRIFNAYLLALVACKAGFYEANFENEVFVAGIILRHTFQAYLNSGSLNDEADKEFSLQTQDFSSPLFLNASLLNHDCTQNAFLTGDHINFGHSLNLIQAMRPIKAGQEVSTNYGFDFMNYDKLEERRKYIKNTYFFNCSCARCLLEERDKPIGFPKYFAIACADCGALMGMPQSGMGFYKCPAGHRLSMREMKDKYRQVATLLSQVDQFIKAIEAGNTALVPQFEALLRNELCKLLCRTAAHQLIGLFDKLTEFLYSTGKLNEALSSAEESLDMSTHQFGREHAIIHGQLSSMMQMFVENSAFRDVRKQAIATRFVQSRGKLLPDVDRSSFPN